MRRDVLSVQYPQLQLRILSICAFNDPVFGERGSTDNKLKNKKDQPQQGVRNAYTTLPDSIEAILMIFDAKDWVSLLFRSAAGKQ